MYSGKPTASVVVSELAAEHCLGTIDGRRRLNDAGQKAVELTASRLVSVVDEILATKPSAKPLVSITAAPTPEKMGLGCACGSEMPVRQVSIGGYTIGVMGLPLIFANLRDRGIAPDMAAEELMANVEIYNYVAPSLKSAYREELLREYTLFWNGGTR